MTPAGILRRVGALAVLALVGCAETATLSPPAEVDVVDRLHIKAPYPATVDADGKPGAEGVKVHVFMERAGHDAPALAKGTLDFAMYPGRLSRKSLVMAEPLEVWHFSAEELAGSAKRDNLFGYFYPLVLLWGEEAPQTPVVTLMAKYTAPSGQTAYPQAPLVVRVGN